ncbi:MAG: CapA family protein [Agathobacter sp.]|nr:CapA family protein [Agathobacter sp.]
MRKRFVVLLLMGSLLLTGCGKSNSSKPTEPVGDVDTAAIEVGTDSESENQSATDMQETESQEPVPEEKTITITATGDCTLGKTQSQGYSGSFWSYYDNNGPDYFFKGVRDVFESDDFTLINLECVLTNSENRVEKTFNLKGKPEYTAIMTGSSVEACSLGNNHTMDYGEESLTDTQNALDSAGIVYGYNDHVGTYTTEDGLVIGIVSASLLSMSEDRVDYLKNGIESLKGQNVDLIIASCHWGIERQYYPNEYQQSVAHQLIDCGADVVIGNHPHVLQGIEVYNGKVICYSLGNFCFGGNLNPSDKDTMMFQQTFKFVDGELQSDIDVRIIPCRLSSTTGHNDFQPTIMTDNNKQRIIDNVNSYSSPYSNISFDSEGTMLIKE